MKLTKELLASESEALFNVWSRAVKFILFLLFLCTPVGILYPYREFTIKNVWGLSGFIYYLLAPRKLMKSMDSFSYGR